MTRSKTYFIARSSVAMMSGVILITIRLCSVMLSVIMLRANMLNIIMLSVNFAEYHYALRQCAEAIILGVSS